ncbi:MAG: acyl-CoA dehydrogenase family protein [Solirubrobacteraceae bacterium]
MTNLDLAAPSAELEGAIAEFRRIFAEFAAEAGAIDQERMHPFRLIRALADAGFGRLRVPVEHRGFGVTLPELFELLAEAGRADSNIPQILRGHFTTVEILRHEPDESRRAYWLARIAEGAVFGNAQSEPATVGAGFNIQTRVRELGGGQVISGTKFYSTGSLFADYIRVAALDEEDSAVFAVVPARHEGVVHVDDWDGIGQRLTGSGTTHFDDVPVEEQGELGRSREDLKSIGPFVQIVHLANLAGIARNLVDDAVELVRSRRRTSLHALSEQASDDPEVLGVVGEIKRRSVTADSLLRTASESLEAANARWEAGDRADDLYTESYIVTSAAQVAIIEAVLEAGNLIFAAGGSSAVRQGGHLDRHWRNARTLASHNPVIYKPRVIGDYVVNGRLPKAPYDRQRKR